jgi:cell division protein FtsB
MATAYSWMGRGNGAVSEELPVAGQSREFRPAKPRLVTRPARPGPAKYGHGKKPPMVEFCTVKKIDNSRLVRHVEPVRMRNLFKTAALGGFVALFFMLYIYQHFRCIDLSFQLEDLKAKQEQAQDLNAKSKLEIATLRDPQRIDLLARRWLGLTQPTAAQVREYANLTGAEVAAVQYVRPNRAP